MMRYQLHIRFRVNLVKEAASILFVEYTGVSPGLIFKWLDILYLNEQDITGLCCLDVEWTREVVDLS